MRGHSPFHIKQLHFYFLFTVSLSNMSCYDPITDYERSQCLKYCVVCKKETWIQQENDCSVESATAATATASISMSSCSNDTQGSVAKYFSMKNGSPDDFVPPTSCPCCRNCTGESGLHVNYSQARL